MGELNKIILRAAKSSRRVNRNGTIETIPTVEAIVEKQNESALKGNSISLRTSIGLIERAMAEEEARIADECARWEAVKDRHQALLDRASARGETAPRLFPHPDDILIDRRVGVRIVGPVSKEDWPQYDMQVKLRDALFLQDRVECREGRLEATKPSSAFILAMFMNERMAPSLRLSQAEAMDRMMSARSLTQRDVLKLAPRALRQAGIVLPRGNCLPPPEDLIPVLKIMLDFGKDVFAAQDDGEVQDAVDQCSDGLAAEKYQRQKRRAIAMHINQSGEQQS